MSTYKIHPIVMGTKVFDKSMMTYQHGQGVEYTIPIYCWYIEGGDKKILVDTDLGFSSFSFFYGTCSGDRAPYY